MPNEQRTDLHSASTNSDPPEEQSITITANEVPSTSGNIQDKFWMDLSKKKLGEFQGQRNDYRILLFSKYI